MADKVLQAIFKLKDEMSKPLKEISTATKDVKQVMKDASSSIEGVGDSSSDSTGDIDKMANALNAISATSVANTLSNITQGFIDMGKSCIDAYKDVKTGTDALMLATGATGEVAEGLKDSFSNVAGNFPADMQSIGGAMGEVNTRFGSTGAELEQTTEQFLKFAKITGQDATRSVQLVSRAMGDAGIDASEYSNVLDALAVAGQASGIGVDKLAESLTKYGAPMRALGYDTKESIALFATWEKAGVNTEIAFGGMKTAIGNWGKEGKDAREEFGKTIQAIKDAPNIASATAMAIETFGQKAGPDLADAIQGGRFGVEEMQQILENCSDTVDNTFGQISDATMEWQVAQNNIKLATSEFGGELLGALAPSIEFVSDKIKAVTEWFKGLDDNTKKNIAIAALFVGGLLVVGTTIATIVVAVAGFSAALGALGGVAAITGGIIAFLTSPITLVIGAVIACIGAVALLWGAWKNNFGGIQDKTNEVINAVKLKIDSIKETFGNVKQSVIDFKDSIVEKWNEIEEAISNNPIVATVKKVTSSLTGESNDGRAGAYGIRKVTKNDELFKLHQGERVLSQQETRQYENGISGGINIAKLADTIVVREEADINKIADELAKKLKQQRLAFAGSY